MRDRLLQVDPTNSFSQALYAETSAADGRRRVASTKDPDSEAGGDGCSGAGRLRPKGVGRAEAELHVRDADFARTLKAMPSIPTLYSAIGYDALLKKDSATLAD